MPNTNIYIAPFPARSPNSEIKAGDWLEWEGDLYIALRGAADNWVEVFNLSESRATFFELPESNLLILSNVHIEVKR